MDSEVRKMEGNLLFVWGQLRNLLSVGELSKHQLLRDKIIKSIRVLESISEWLEDPTGRKVSSEVIESSLSKLSCTLNQIEDEIDTFLVKKELPYRWGRKVLIKKKQILSSITDPLDNFVLSVDSERFERVENSEPKTKKNLEEEEEEASIPTSRDNGVEILKSSELGNQQHPRRRSTYVVANFKDAALIHAGECMQSGIQNDREMYSDAGVFNMSDRVYFEESENESDVVGHDELAENILTSSYQDLPLHMKLCFLYLGLFPRGFQIPVRRLLHLWHAEGLVTPLPEQNMASEDVAEEYLKELINRSMIEVAGLRSDGRPKTCRMPGFLWDFFFPKAVTLGVFHVHNTSAERPEFNVRRLAEWVSIKTYPSSDPYIQHLHSYISFNTRKSGLPTQEIGTFLNTIVTKRGFGLLRVLDLEGVYKPMLREILKKFFHLKYLGLRRTSLDSFPLSTGTLPNLETLDVKHTNITTLPSSIWKAKNLRHLYMSEILQKPSGIVSLTNLQTLWGLYIGEKKIVYNCLDKLTALRKLGLSFNSTSKKAIAKWISQLTNLQSLRLRSSSEFGQPEDLMLGNITEQQKLSDLYLLGQLRRGIRELQLPPNLKILTLSASKLEEDPMPMLGKLPHLNILRLFGKSFVGKQIACLCEGFPELRVLKLWMLEELEEWIVEKGTMPRLGELEIRRCIKLRQPEGLQLVTTLKDLILTNMPEDFVTNVKTVMDKSVFIKKNNWSFAPLPV